MRLREQKSNDNRNRVTMHALAPTWLQILIMLSAVAAAVAVWAAIYWPMIRRRKLSLWSLIMLTLLVAVALGIVRLMR